MHRKLSAAAGSSKASIPSAHHPFKVGRFILHAVMVLSMLLSYCAPVGVQAANAPRAGQEAEPTSVPPTPEPSPVAGAEVQDPATPGATESVTTTLTPTPQPDSTEETLTQSALGATDSVTATLTPNPFPILGEGVEMEQEKVTLLPLGGGQADGLGGSVQVSVPEGAADEALAVTVRRPAIFPPDPPGGWPFEIVASGQVDKIERHQFKQPLTLSVAYDPKTLRGDENSQILMYYDEARRDWFPIGTYVDTKNHLLIATVDHLTVFDTTFGDWEAPMLPGLQDFQVSQFSGAATYSKSLWVPPGPGGLQPSLELSYNSQAVDDAIAKETQASWVGMGWSLDTGYIERNGESQGPDYETFSISAAGVNSLLLPKDGYYHTTDESFWRIKYDDTKDVWYAWDKNGTMYTFGDPTTNSDGARARYPYNEYSTYDPYKPNHCKNPGFLAATWRWGLYSITNVYGKSVTFTYFRDKLDRSHPCDEDVKFPTDIWMYPETITYPAGHYQVVFEHETRTDIKNGWEDSDGKNFFQRYRLKAVSVKLDGNEIRRYDFGYYLDTEPKIFPGAQWTIGGYTLALKQVVETGKDGEATLTLPATNFDYADNMHLTSANNGYGGLIQFAYESTPWYETTATVDKSIYHWGCDSNNGRLIPRLQGINGGDAGCDSVHGMVVHGDAYMPDSVNMPQPGGAYGLYAEVTGVDGTNPHVILSVAGVAGPSGYPNNNLLTLKGPVVLPSTAGGAYFQIHCSVDCSVADMSFGLKTTRYRVIQKTVYDGINSTGQVFTYRYDEGATNDSTHSVSGGTSNPLMKTYSEYRGNAEVTEVGPDGRANSTFFYQDDGKKGRVSASVVTDESFHDDFDSLNGANWNSSPCSGTQASIEQIRGEPALKMMATGAWHCIQRTGDTIQDGEAVLTQFMVNSSATPQASLSLDSSSPYRRWGVYLKTDASLVVQYSDGQTYNDGGTLLGAGAFKKDTWYVLLLVVGGDQSLAQVWERDNPSQGGFYRRAMTTGLNWHFISYIMNGTVRVDAYSEGKPYSLSQSVYASSSLAPSALPQCLNWPEYGSCTGLLIYNTTLTQETTQSFEGSGQWTGVRKYYSYNSYDSYDNRLRETVSYWNGSNWQDYRFTKTGYFPYTNTDVYLVGLLAYTNIYTCPPGLYNNACSTNYPNWPPDNLAVSSEVNNYDGQLAYNAPPTIGKLTAKRKDIYWAGASDPRLRDEVYGYDEWGNLTSTTVYNSEGTTSTRASANPQTNTSTYDTTYHTYVIQESNGVLPATMYTYDYNLGLPKTMTGPNGTATKITVYYDAVGRLTKVVRPGDSSSNPTLQITYNDLDTVFNIELRQRIDGTQFATAHKYYNGLGQLIQDQTIGATLGEGVRDVLTDYTYDAYGRPVKKSVPYAVGSGSGYRPNPNQLVTLTTYDVLGRTEVITGTDQTVTSFIYSISPTDGHEQVEQIDARGKSMITHSDAWGRTVEVIPEIGPSVVYTYTVADQLAEVERGGAKTKLFYDIGGRKTQMVDPDMGTWNYGYDTLGNLTSQIDARTCQTTLSYGTLNRLASKNYSGVGCGQTTWVGYTYDQGTNGYGKRTSMNDATGGSTAWNYDTRGRVITETQVISGTMGGTFVTGWGYNSADLQKSIKYPGGDSGTWSEKVNSTYYDQMALSAVTSSTYSYAANVSYDAAGRVTQRTLGTGANSVQTQYTYFPWSSQGGRLEWIKSGTTGNPEILQKLQYNYDSVGNVLSIQDTDMTLTPTIQTQTFGYDALNRLTGAMASGGRNGRGDYNESTGGMGYTYDPDTGNLDSKAGVTYFYSDTVPYTNTLHIHAVTSLSNGNTYQYDANGNMTQRVVSGQTYNLTYDAENRLVAVSGAATAQFVYDGDGNRIKATINGTTTTYIGNYFEWTGSASTRVRYYYAGGVRVAMRTGTAAPLWLLGDHLGSTSVTANYNGTLNSPQGYMAWGETRYGSSPTRHQFTGQFNQTELGLYFYGARFYDPSLGRFASPDTIIPQSSQGVQAWDRYAGMNNNPLKYIDPSGHKADDCEEMGDCNIHGGEILRDLGKDIIYAIKVLYGIKMEASDRMSWSLANLKTAYAALNTMNDALQGGLKSMVSGTTFKIMGGGDQYYGWTKNPIIEFHVAGSGTKIPIINFFHETGHLLNQLIGDAFASEVPKNPTWVKDGYVDPTILKGNVKEPVQAIPMNEPNSPDEYWADAFGNFVASNIDLAQSAGQDMYNFVAGELGLPLYVPPSPSY